MTEITANPEDLILVVAEKEADTRILSVQDYLKNIDQDKLILNYEKTLIVKDGVYAVFDQTIKYLNQDEIKAVLKSKGVKQ